MDGDRMAGEIDTLTIYQRLKSANIKDEAAKEIAEVFKDVTESNLASKTDIAFLHKEIELVRSDLKKEIELVRSDLQKEIQITKADILKWVAGMLIAQSAFIAALIKLL